MSSDDKAGALELLQLTGTPVHPMSPLVKLIWFSQHAPS